jgi:hypothetical protein
MPIPKTHEQSINDALGEVLRGLSRRWTVRSEKIGEFVGGGRPDILIETDSEWPVVLEAEVANHRQAEKEALSRIGRQLTNNVNPVETAIALVYSEEMRTLEGANLRNKLSEAVFDYAVYQSGPEDSAPYRFPRNGFLKGDVFDLVFALNKANASAARIAVLTDILEKGINAAEATTRIRHEIGGAHGVALAEALGQKDDEGGQTRKMALTVVANALVFHETLSQAHLLVPEGRRKRPVVSPMQLRDATSRFSPTKMCDEWSRILQINYWPIFSTAKRILLSLGTKDSAMILDAMWSIAEKLIAGGVTRSHDMTGAIFQRLIADRKVLATNYTRPASAALLVGMAMPFVRGAKIPKLMRMGDFACGTGTLLSSAYIRFQEMHETTGIDSEALHEAMMRDGIVGLDVLNVAVHLTAAMLAGTHPKTTFQSECLLTMPYKAEVGKKATVGSISLMAEHPELDLFEQAIRTAGGESEEERINEAKASLAQNTFDLVVMNPPFTRPGNHEGVHVDQFNPAFAAFGATQEEQEMISVERKKLVKGTSADGNAGIGADFVALAERMSKPGGCIAFVLPQSAIVGSTWSKTRELWRTRYMDIIVTTIAGKKARDRSFSMDTDIAECMVVATKATAGMEPSNRARFVALKRRPETGLEGEALAKAIMLTLSDGSIKRLEDGPVGGTHIHLGDDLIGEAVDCPIEGGTWPLAGIDDITLAQTAHQLAKGKLWVARMADPVEIEVSNFAALTTHTAPVDRDIDGRNPDRSARGPFDIKTGCSDKEEYPCLWAHDADVERQMEIAPDTHGKQRGLLLQEKGKKI